MNKTFRSIVTSALIAGAVLLSPVALSADAAGGKVDVLLTSALPEIAGKEATMLTVTYPPGGSSPEHLHNASVFVYVLEGSIVMQVKGGPETTVKAGQVFQEKPGDVHTVSRNASKTAPAKFLVVMVKNVGAPITEPVHH